MRCCANSKPFPEVGTTEQQMRKQYDEKLSDNQLKKLLMGKHILQQNPGASHTSHDSIEE